MPEAQRLRPQVEHEAVLFDLDGTLIDTATDMVAVLQQMQRDYGVEPVSFELARCHVSNGSRGLVTVGFGEQNDADRERLQQEYLQRYAQQETQFSQVFAGLDSILIALESRKIPWGVVTNKPGFLTEPLLRHLGLTARSSVVVAGDTLPERKPHPAPLLHACELAGINPLRTLYVGDALRDIEAGKRAGMETVAAGYGYIVAGDDATTWGADNVANSVSELCYLLTRTFNL